MGGITNIVGFSIRNWRMTMGIMLFAVIGGMLAIKNFPLDPEPDIPIPFVNIRVVLPGVSPEDSHRLLVRPMETELKSIEGLERMDGIATTSSAYVTLRFNASFNQDETIAEILEQMDRARAEFPQEAREPVVQEINSSALPIVVVNLHGSAPEREIQALAKDLKRRIEAVPSVLEANISGEREDVLEAVIDPALMESSGITFGEIARAVASNNSLITAGALQTDSGKFNVKLPGLIENRDDLASLVVRQNPNGSIIRIEDIADVRRGYKDAQNYARFNGTASVSIEVSNRNGANMIRTVAEIRELVDARIARSDWPKTIQVDYSQDRSIDVVIMVQTLFASILNAIILVFIVCIAALGLRSALFVGWAIPASFLMALFLMYVQGEAINFIILFALILSVGILVDGAIVIVEYADRKLAEGLSRMEAYKIAGERMFWPIVSSIATTLAAFLPLLFWDEITGKYMGYMSLTIIYVLTSSLVMALVFLPTLGAYLGPKKLSRDNANLIALSGTEGDPTKLSGPMGVYTRVIAQLIKLPELVLLVTVILLTLITLQFRASMGGDNPKPVEFFTNTPSDQVLILARVRGNTTPAENQRLAIDIENRIKDVAGIQAIYSTAGTGLGGASGEQSSGGIDIPIDTVVKVYPQLMPFAERRKTAVIMDELREKVADIPGIFVEVVAESQGPPIGKDVAIQLTSDDTETLRQTTRRVRAYLEDFEGLYEVEDDLPLPGVEWEIEVDQAEAGRLGLNVSDIGAAIQFLTEGSLVGQFRPLDSDEEVDIRVRFPRESRDLQELDTLRILTPNGAIPLSSVVKRVPKPRLDSIKSRDQRFLHLVKANTRPGYATNIQVAELKDWIANEANLPEDVDAKFLGQEEENAEATAFFQAAGIAILFMMGIILLLQFNSFYHVFLTLLAVILSLFGVLLGLTYYPYLPLVPTIVGVLALAGIVVNNNIVLIDTYQRLRSNGFDPVDSALRTAAQRLRPVFLTTVTTMVGLFPMVLSWQADIFTGVLDFKGNITSDIFAPISYVIVIGLGFATLLTLIITPVLLAMPTIMMGRFRLLYRRFAPA